MAGLAVALLVPSQLGTGSLRAQKAAAVTIDTGAYYQLVARHSDKAVDVLSASTAEGAAVAQWQKLRGANQQFQFVTSPDGHFRIKARHSGKVLAVANASNRDGAAVVQATDTGSTSQQWSVRDTGAGDVVLVNRRSGRVLDVYQASTGNGASIVQWGTGQTPGDNQRWTLTKVDSVSTPPTATSTPAPAPPTTTPPPTTTTTAPAPPTSSAPVPTTQPPTSQPPTSDAPGTSAPSRAYATSQRFVTITRAGRTLETRIVYPTDGAARTDGRVNSTDGPVASGRFPLVIWSHGITGNYNTYSDLMIPLARAGFVVAAPTYPGSTGSNGSGADGFNGNQAKDATEIISNVLARNESSSDALFKHIDTTRGVGAAGHSLGGITSHGLISGQKDSRVTAAVMFGGSGSAKAVGSAVNVLFIHGDDDPTFGLSGIKSTYNGIPWSKGFLTVKGGKHDKFCWPGRGSVGYQQARDTFVDWMRWSLYGDSAARDRLPSDARSDITTWESVFR